VRSRSTSLARHVLSIHPRNDGGSARTALGKAAPGRETASQNTDEFPTLGRAALIGPLLAFPKNG
jgi:hypothetical protein